MVSETNMTASLGTLPTLPALTALRAKDTEHVVLTRKFVEGMLRYTQLWPGPVKVIVAPDKSGQQTNLDYESVRMRDLPFEVEVLPFEREVLQPKLAGNALVLAGPDWRLPRLAEMCREAQAPCVNITEYSLATRLQIIRLESENPLRFARSAAWELNQERLNRRNIARSAGVQCNGTPTFNQYRKLSPNPMLFFDTRTEQSMFAKPEDMQRRAARLSSGQPLTLAFSGRLLPMKGADDLIDVARHLKRAGFPFRMIIAGDGPSLPAMRRRAQEAQLSEIEFLGVLPFDTGLMPLVREQVDLFVCCHRQGDPSCTYLETLSAGVPIAGFDNEAFKGLLQIADVGVSAPLGDAAALARTIRGLSRERLKECAQNALSFASKHDFATTFERRIAHMMSIADSHQLRSKRPSQAPSALNY